MCVEYCRIMSKTSATLERSSGLPQLNSIDFFKIVVTVVNGSYSSSFAGVDLFSLTHFLKSSTDRPP